MINKVLIAEDHQSASISIQKTLVDLQVPKVDYVFYCDDALMEIKRAVQTNDPYDLLITDLYFEPDHLQQKLSGGAALIAAAKQAQPALAILVFSGESKANVIETLIETQQIDGFVRKARHDAEELSKAIEHISRHQNYFPRALQQLLKQKNAHQFTQYDITVIELLAEGIRQKEIPKRLEARNLQPFGLSSLEKRLAFMREKLSFANNEQLVAFCKDKGII
jgi:two-component system capsular synthesis response regulator RcsB